MDLTVLCKCNSQKHKCMKEGRVCTPIVHLLCSQSVDIFVHLTVLSALVSFHTEETASKLKENQFSCISTNHIRLFSPLIDNTGTGQKTLIV